MLLSIQTVSACIDWLSLEVSTPTYTTHKCFNMHTHAHIDNLYGILMHYLTIKTRLLIRHWKKSRARTIQLDVYTPVDTYIYIHINTYAYTCNDRTNNENGGCWDINGCYCAKPIRPSQSSDHRCFGRAAASLKHTHLQIHRYIFIEIEK